MKARPFALSLCFTALAASGALASSHREAPYVTEHPKIDTTDFYVFNSYEPGREDYVTLVANFIPLQDAYGGPNYFTLDPEALYEIHIDNSGDAIEDLTFQFRFKNQLEDIALDIGPAGQSQRVSVPVINVGGISAGNITALNIIESYTLTVVQGDRRTGRASLLTNALTSEEAFLKPVDNIGNKSIADYPGYAAAHVYTINLPGTDDTGRVFVGQRKDPFVVNLGEVFDLVNITNPLGPVDAEQDDLADKNVTALCLELPKSFVNAPGRTIVGAWATASLRQARVLDPTPSYNKPSVEGGRWVQVSRLGMPLVNEVVIGLKDKNRFNSSKPRHDGQFLHYVTHPTLPEILEILYGGAGVQAPNLFPRADLVAAFLTGIDGLNKTETPSEMQRLNTAIAATPAASQSPLGVPGGDLAGFPNGRRPGDDVVDIELRVAMGVLLPVDLAPSGQLPFTDGALSNSSLIDNAFPYLRSPIPGSPNATP